MPLIAGTAVAEISPEKSMFLVGYPHVERMSTGVHDPLLASALFLKNGDSAVVLVACDILFFDPPTCAALRECIARRTGVRESDIFITCSHTHSGPTCLDMISWKNDPVVPPVDREYLAFVMEQIVRATVLASRSLRPAALAWAMVPVEGVGGNRIDPKGPCDRTAATLVVRDEPSGRIRAVSLTYGMHPTVMHEDSTLVSSDFPHYTREALRDALGAEVTVLYHMGPSGNQSPRYSVKAQTFPEAERLGRMLGDPVARAVAALPDAAFDANPVLGSCIEAVSLPRRTLPDAAGARKNLADCQATFARLKAEKAPHGPVRTAECALFGAEETVVLSAAQESGELKRMLDAKYDPLMLQTVRIGAQCLCGLPCEIFCEYGLALKEQTKGRAIAVSLVNGETQGYVVTPEAEAAGGYEATNACFAPAAGTLMVATLRAQTERLLRS